jgi:hypothetical protein
MKKLIIETHFLNIDNWKIGYCKVIPPCEPSPNSKWWIGHMVFFGPIDIAYGKFISYN